MWAATLAKQAKRSKPRPAVPRLARGAVTVAALDLPPIAPLGPKYRNRWEADYAQQLEALQRAGIIRRFWYEAITFKLGPDCRYTPDFTVQMADGTIAFHEVKGLRRAVGMVKIRVTSEQYPMWCFYLVERVRRGAPWSLTPVG